MAPARRSAASFYAEDAGSVDNRQSELLLSIVLVRLYCFFSAIRTVEPLFLSIITKGRLPRPSPRPTKQKRGSQAMIRSPSITPASILGCTTGDIIRRAHLICTGLQSTADYCTLDSIIIPPMANIFTPARHPSRICLHRYRLAGTPPSNRGFERLLLPKLPPLLGRDNSSARGPALRLPSAFSCTPPTSTNSPACTM